MRPRTLIVATICTLALCAFVLVAATPAQASTANAPANAGGAITYTVRVGDTWTKISNLFGVSASRLLDVNERRTTNRINLFAGEVLKIPVELGTIPSLTSPFLYTVQSGDTVESVWRKFNIDKFSLLSANSLPFTQINLTAGQILFVPAGPHRYQIQKGDSLQSIAALFGTTVDKYLPFNPQLSNGKIFYPGMYVYIPIVYDIGFTASPFGGAVSGSATTSTVTSTVTFSGTGLTPTVPNPDEVVRAANANVVTVVETISMPQNVVNLNQLFEHRLFRLNNVQRDFSRENGAIATITFEFRGGSGTYTFKTFFNNGIGQRGAKMTGIYVNNDQGQLWNNIDLPVETTCTSTASGDFIVTTSNVTKFYHYEFKNIQCPAK